MMEAIRDGMVAYGDSVQGAAFDRRPREKTRE